MGPCCPTRCRSRESPRASTSRPLLALDGGQAEALRGDPHVNLAVSEAGSWLSVAGRAAIVEDRAVIDELWNEQAREYFPNGKEDPNLGLLRVSGDSAQSLGAAWREGGRGRSGREGEGHRRSASGRHRHRRALSAMPRTLAAGQRCRVRVLDVDTGEDRVVHESDQVLYEAPNWTADGRWLIINGDGHLFRLAVSGGEPQRIELGDLPALNNDHVLSPDGHHIYLSADDGHIHRAPLTGGPATRITHDEDRPISCTGSAPTAPPSRTSVWSGWPTAPGCRPTCSCSPPAAARRLSSRTTSTLTTAPSTHPTGAGSTSTRSGAAPALDMRSFPHAPRRHRDRTAHGR